MSTAPSRRGAVGMIDCLAARPGIPSEQRGEPVDRGRGLRERDGGPNGSRARSVRSNIDSENPIPASATSAGSRAVS